MIDVVHDRNWTGTGQGQELDRDRVKGAALHYPSCKIHLLGHEASVQPCKTIPASPSKCALPAKKGHTYIFLYNTLLGRGKAPKPPHPPTRPYYGCRSLDRALPIQSDNSHTLGTPSTPTTSGTLYLRMSAFGASRHLRLVLHPACVTSNQHMYNTPSFLYAPRA